MIPPPSAFPPSDPSVDEALEKRLRQAGPAPVQADLMNRLLQARTALSESGVSSNGKAAAAAFPRHPRFYSRQALAAAALLACGWAGWRATAPDAAPGPVSGPTADNHPRLSPPPAGNSFPGMEFLPSMESRQHLLQVRELGVIRDSQQRPVRLMSATWLDENTYGHSASDPALHEARLRHEIVPVLLPTY